MPLRRSALIEVCRLVMIERMLHNLADLVLNIELKVLLSLLFHRFITENVHFRLSWSALWVIKFLLVSVRDGVVVD